MIIYDWRLADASQPNIDPRPWKLHIVEASEVSYRIQATCPDGTEREVWLEIQDARFVIHAYDPEHEEPVNLRIGRTGITIDSDRDVVKQDDPLRGERIEEFVRHMAGLSIPEEEFQDEGYADVEEYVADLDDDRLCGEYATFMDMVRAVREVLK